MSGWCNRRVLRKAYGSYEEQDGKGPAMDVLVTSCRAAAKGSDQLHRYRRDDNAC